MSQSLSLPAQNDSEAAATATSFNNKDAVTDAETFLPSKVRSQWHADYLNNVSPLIRAQPTQSTIGANTSHYPRSPRHLSN